MFTQDQTFEMKDISIIIDATKRCQLKCGYCYFGDKTQNDMDPEKVETSLVNFTSLFPDLEKIDIRFMGAEPLIVWDKIVPFITKIRKKFGEKGIAFSWGLTSNLIALDDEKTDFMIQEKAGIHCSIDGPPEIHNANRPFANGKPSFETVVKNIQNALKITPNDTARATVRPEAANLCVEIADTILGLGFKYVGIFPSTGQKEEWTDEAISQYVYSYAQAYRKSPEYKKWDRAVRGLIKPSYPKKQKYFDYCGAGKGLWAIDVNGKLYHCHHFTSDEVMHFADHLDSPEEIRRKIMMSEFSPHIKIREIPETCQKCKAIEFCNGGCWAENLHNLNESRQQNDPTCKIFIGLVEELGNEIRMEEPPTPENSKMASVCCMLWNNCNPCNYFDCSERCYRDYCNDCGGF